LTNPVYKTAIRQVKVNPEDFEILSVASADFTSTRALLHSLRFALHALTTAHCAEPIRLLFVVQQGVFVRPQRTPHDDAKNFSLTVRYRC
jgi:hypothetical protein